jgi:DNA polymerase
VIEKAPAPWSLAWKEQMLYSLYSQWHDCDRCPLHNTRKNVVFGIGNPNAKIMLVGEAPGEDEDATGEPFCGASGQLLRALLDKARISSQEIYITNVLGCRPVDDKGKNRDPSVLERDACSMRLNETIYIVDPWFIVPVGKIALKALARGRDWSILENRGKVFSSPHASSRLVGDRNSAEIQGRVFPRKDPEKREVHLEYDLVPILHPSYLLREDSYDEKKNRFPADGITQKTLQDLKRIKQLVEALEAEYRAVPKFQNT